MGGAVLRRFIQDNGMKKHWNPLQAWRPELPKSSGKPMARSANSADRAPGVGAATLPRSVMPGQVVVILPVYNEQACIGTTFEAIRGYLYTHPNYRFVFVNDGSTDRTREILTGAIKAAQDPRLQLMSYSPRGGKGYAIKVGMEQAQGDFLCYLDSDLAYSLEHLDRLVEKLHHCDVAIGCRSLVASNPQGLRPSRKVAGKTFNWLSRKLLNLNYRDMQAGLKGFRRESAQDLFGHQSLMGFSFDVELIYLAQKRGYRIGEVPAAVSRAHQQKISKVNLLQDSLCMLRDLFGIRINDIMGRYR
jgi:dolichyl-phosphate beta-glucosyltransferase